MEARAAPPCNDTCVAFMAASGVRTAQHQMNVPLTEAKVAFIACTGLGLGGAQIRCAETARVLSARGTPSTCVDKCDRGTLAQFRNLHLLAVVFIRVLPDANLLSEYIRPATCSLLLDTLDMSPIYHAHSCSSVAHVRHLDALIANNHASWTRVAENCPRLRGKPLHLIEHFHSVTRRVSDGSRWRRRPQALLVQEHRVRHVYGFCHEIEVSLPNGTKFECLPLWGGTNAPKNRLHFLSSHLSLPAETVRAISAQHFGTGAMFTAVYKEQDLLIQWLGTNSSAQRLTNSLASGVPTIAQRCPAFEEAVAGETDVLLASSHEEMREMASKLATSVAFRKRVSDAGVAVAARFSPDAIYQLYLRAFNAQCWRVGVDDRRVDKL